MLRAAVNHRIACSDHVRDASQWTCFLGRAEETGSKKERKSKFTEMIVPALFPFSRTRPIASVCACTYSPTPQLETLQIAGYSVQKHFWKLKLIKSTHTSQWPPFLLTVAPSLTPTAAPASRSSQPRAPSHASASHAQRHRGAVNTHYYYLS